MRRRDFIRLLGGAAAWPLAARAQQQRLPVVGVLNGLSAGEWTGPMGGFQRGLGEVGYVEGRNVAIEYRWAEGQYDRIPAMAADLVKRNVAVILVGGHLPAVQVAMAATKTIPIVFTTNSDPVANRLVASLNRPGGNVTGVTGLGGELVPKRLEVLHQLIPSAGKFAVLVNPTNLVTAQEARRDAPLAAGRLGLEIILVEASNETEIDKAFEGAAGQGAVGLLGVDAYFESRRDQIAALSLRHRLPAVLGSREAVAAGMLMFYGADVVDFYRQAGVYVGRILKGEKPTDLPVLQPTKFELAINLRTAKALGLNIPPTLLATADEVIE